MKLQLSLIFGILTCLLAAGVPGQPVGAAEVARDDRWDILGLTAADALNMREEPSLSAPVVAQLRWGSMVGIHTDTYRPVEIDGRQERWVFVSAISCSPNSGCYTLKAAGWVIESYLATADRFEPMATWRPGEVSDETGEIGGTYKIAADGSFTHWAVPCWDGNCGENREYDVCREGERREDGYCVVAGQLERYRNLVRAKMADGSTYIADGSTYELLYIDEFGALCSVNTWLYYGEGSCDR